MKIGVVTPYDSANYGAYLQAYATQKYLEELGHQVEFIKWRTEEERKGVFFKTSANLIVRFKSLLRKKHNMENYQKMTEALKHFNIVGSNIKNRDFDLIILGSDEIWNINVPNFQKNVFYGENAANIPALAYAPSAGNAKYEDFKAFPIICDLMKKVDIVGVRDENTASIVNSVCGYIPQIVCDPTCLLNIDDYEIPAENTLRQPYLLVYSYYVDDTLRQYIVRFAREKKMKLVAACMYQSWCDINICCEPLEFLNVIRNAEYVFTSTFHGSIFTLLHHKKCAIDARSKKLMDLIKWTEMESTVVHGNDSYENFCARIDNDHEYDKFEKNLEVKRSYSRNLYKNCLDKFKGETNESDM